MRIAAFLAFTPACQATSCLAPVAPRYMWEKSAAVFVAMDDRAGARSSISVTVQESFKGPRAGQRLELPVLWDPEEAVGQKLLFYAGQDEGQLTTRVCGWTRQFNRAADDLRFLRKLPASAKSSRLAGTLLLYDAGLSKVIRPLAGVTVTVRGWPGTAWTITSPDGVFEFYGLPAGAYTVTPELRGGLQMKDVMQRGKLLEVRPIESTTVQMEEGGARGVDFKIVEETRERAR